MAASDNVIVLDDEGDDEVQITGVTSCRGPDASDSYSNPQEKCASVTEPEYLDHFGNTGSAAGQPLGAESTTRAAASSSLSRGQADDMVESAGGSFSKDIQIQEVLATAVPTSPEISPEDEGVQEKNAAEGSEKQIKSPFTPKFFSDMADQIASNFPYNEFAASHDCSVEDASRALMATVINTLLAKHTNVGLLDEEGDFQAQVDMWNLQYEETVRTLEAGDNSTELHKQLDQAVAATHGKTVHNSENTDIGTAMKRSRSEMEAGDTTSPPDDLPTEPHITLSVPEFADLRPAKKPRTDPATRACLQSALRKVNFGSGIASDGPVRNVSATLTKALSTVMNHQAPRQPEPEPVPVPVPPHERHLKYPEISRRRRVVRDGAGSYHTAPFDQEEFDLAWANLRPAAAPGHHLLPDIPTPAAGASGPEACKKSLYDVATEKDREVWERLFKRKG